MKTYCLSDLHIGYEQSNYSKIKEILELVRKDADELIIVGDCFDLWRNDPITITQKEPFKSIYQAILDVAKVVPTTIVWGNHEYNLDTMLDLPGIVVTDDFVRNGILFTHGWRFDVDQRIGSYFYSWIVKYFPPIYQLFFKKPSTIPKAEEENGYMAIYDEVKKVLDENIKMVVMGHTHNPIAIDEKIYDCGDFVDSLSYIIIENGQVNIYRLDH